MIGGGLDAGRITGSEVLDGQATRPPQLRTHADMQKCSATVAGLCVRARVRAANMAPAYLSLPSLPSSSLGSYLRQPKMGEDAHALVRGSGPT